MHDIYSPSERFLIRLLDGPHINIICAHRPGYLIEKPKLSDPIQFIYYGLTKYVFNWYGPLFVEAQCSMQYEILKVPMGYNPEDTNFQRYIFSTPSKRNNG